MAISITEGILTLIGNTPLVEFSRLFRDFDIHFFAKLEQFNPGGSTKDRPAINIIQQGIESGEIQKDTVVIESSSGNMGIGLAQVCAYHKLRFVCVVDSKTTAQNIELLKAYKAEVVVVTKPEPATGEFLPARIQRVRELLGCFPNSFWPNQYDSRFNSNAHHKTMAEIIASLDGRVDYLFCATSTCGTLRGCAEQKKDQRLRTKIVAVDAIGSVIFGGHKAKRLIPGHGAALVPGLYQQGLADNVVQVTDLECVVGCRRLASEEAFLAGGSSGAIIAAVEKLAPSMVPGACCVGILADRGERYLNTIYSDNWIREHFGEVSHLWQTNHEVRDLARVSS